MSTQKKFPWLLLLLTVSFITGVIVVWTYQTQYRQTQSKDLPIYSQLENFQLTNRYANPMGSSDLKGKVWVVDFMFTSCTEECPLMAVEMAKLEQRFMGKYPDFRLVSVTVDPDVDTADRLKKYASALNAHPKNWLFLTGQEKELNHLAIQQFKLPVQDMRAEGNQHHHHHADSSKTEESQPKSSPFLHSQKFVLVDQKMQIRGYYDSNDPKDMDKLIEQDLPRLLH